MIKKDYVSFSVEKCHMLKYGIVVSHHIQKSTSKCQAPVSQYFINFTDWYMLQYCCVCLCSWQSGILNHTESGCWLFLYLLFKKFILAGF